MGPLQKGEICERVASLKESLQTKTKTIIRHRACAHGVPGCSFWCLCSVLWFWFVWFFENGEKGGGLGHARHRAPLCTPPETTKTPYFFIVFSMPFWIDFWSILLPNLAPKIYQNRSKIDGKMHSILDSIFPSRLNLKKPTKSKNNRC